jgi:hypothetical protein
VALGAVDVDGLARFYATVFDLPEVVRHRHDDGALRSVWLDLGGSILMIERSEVSEARVERIGRGPFLLAFRVTAAERARFEERLERAGAPIEMRSRHSSYARDPEGNRIAVSHHPDDG